MEGLIEGIADTPQKQMRYLRAIRTRAGDLERLIDSLSLYNRLDNTDFHYHLERRDLKEFLEEYGRSIREDLEKDQVDMRLELPQKPCMVLLDAGEFQRILDNAVSNSVKYREKPQSFVSGMTGLAFRTTAWSGFLKAFAAWTMPARRAGRAAVWALLLSGRSCRDMVDRSMRKMTTALCW